MTTTAGPNVLHLRFQFIGRKYSAASHNLSCVSARGSRQPGAAYWEILVPEAGRPTAFHVPKFLLGVLKPLPLLPYQLFDLLIQQLHHVTDVGLGEDFLLDFVDDEFFKVPAVEHWGFTGDPPPTRKARGRCSRGYMPFLSLGAVLALPQISHLVTPLSR